MVISTLIYQFLHLYIYIYIYIYIYELVLSRITHIERYEQNKINELVDLNRIR